MEDIGKPSLDRQKDEREGIEQALAILQEQMRILEQDHIVDAWLEMAREGLSDPVATKERMDRAAESSPVLNRYRRMKEAVRILSGEKKLD